MIPPQDIEKILIYNKLTIIYLFILTILPKYIKKEFMYKKLTK